MPKFYRAGEHPSEWALTPTAEVPRPQLPKTTHPIVKILNGLPPGIFQPIPGFVGPFYNKYIMGLCNKDKYESLEEHIEAAQNTNCKGITRKSNGNYELRANKYKPTRWKLSPDSIVCIPAKLTEEYSWVRTSGNSNDYDIKPRDVLEASPKLKAQYKKHQYPKDSIIKASRR